MHDCSTEMRRLNEENYFSQHHINFYVGGVEKSTLPTATTLPHSLQMSNQQCSALNIEELKKNGAVHLCFKKFVSPLRITCSICFISFLQNVL